MEYDSPWRRFPALARALGSAHWWLLPPRCLVCAEPGMPGMDLCAACAAALPWSGPACARCALPLAMPDAACCAARASPLASAQAALVYRWPVDALLRRLKFHQDLAAGRLLAGLMRQRLAVPAGVVMVPVPLHPARLRRRGYDQAAELARPLARALRLPCRRLLRRRLATAPQSELDAAARRRNLRGAFDCVAPVPEQVVLVDDVMTTGATLHAAARALRRAGARRVHACVCARVP